jgi:hypothetical protein
MDKQVLTTVQIIARHEELQRTVKEFETGIKAIRGHVNWEDGIEKDERQTIKILYPAYKKAKAALELFEMTSFIQQIIPSKDGEGYQWP